MLRSRLKNSSQVRGYGAIYLFLRLASACSRTEKRELDRSFRSPKQLARSAVAAPCSSVCQLSVCHLLVPRS